ncbi:MAG: hypothetical protein U1E31_00270 [Rickettsiales bacterium]
MKTKSSDTNVYRYIGNIDRLQFRHIKSLENNRIYKYMMELSLYFQNEESNYQNEESNYQKDTNKDIQNNLLKIANNINNDTINDIRFKIEKSLNSLSKNSSRSEIEKFLNDWKSYKLNIIELIQEHINENNISKQEQTEFVEQLCNNFDVFSDLELYAFNVCCVNLELISEYIE